MWTSRIGIRSRAGAIAVACAIVATFTLSCGGGDGGSATDTTIAIWVQMDPEERSVLTEHLAEVQANHPELTFEVSHESTEDLRTKFQTAALAGGGPDLVFGPSDQIGPFSIMRVIHPLDEILGDALDAFVPEAFDTLDGHVWALPDQLGNHLALVRNTALVPDAPETWDELVAIAKANTVDTNGDGRIDRYGLVFQVGEPFWVIPFLTGSGGWVMDESHAPTLDTPAMVKALGLYDALRNEHGVSPAECDYELAHTLFSEGRAAMIINGPWSWSAYRKAGVDIAISRLPRIDGRWPAPMISSKGYSINARVTGAKLARIEALLEELTSVRSQIDFATRLGTLPTRKAAYQDPAIQSDETLEASRSQVMVGRRMPVVPEMRAIWDAMRPGVQSVWNGSLTPAEAARQMQQEALRKIDEMKG